MHSSSSLIFSLPAPKRRLELLALLLRR